MKQLKPVSKLLPTFDYLHPQYLLKAVLMIYVENRDADIRGVSEYSAASDVWITCPEVVSEGLARMKEHWITLTGKPRDKFINNDPNCFSELYERYRKRNDRDILAYCDDELDVSMTPAVRAEMEAEKAEIEMKMRKNQE